MSHIPTPDSVTPEWITEQLQANGIDAEVESFTRKRIGTGQIGMCFRYGLTYKGSADNAPSSLVGKFPSDDPSSRATGVQLKNFIKEVRFYQELRSTLSIATPKCYYADIIDEGPDFMLLLEDLAPGEQGDQLKGCDAKTAEAAILQLVGLHGPSWNKQELVGVDWLGVPDQTAADMVSGLYQSVLPGFLNRYGDALNQEQQDIISAFGTSQKIKQTELTSPFSLVHIDYRLDNLLIKQTAHGIQATAVDWQSITLGNPMTDVAYFIGAGILKDERRAQEQSLVQKYHDALVASGVTGYDFDACWHDYRKASFAGFSVTVVASMLVQQTERGDQMFTVMADRHSQHALDLGAAEFL
jgi:aminoglycoside/choline kinase family phosphotransferase